MPKKSTLDQFGDRLRELRKEAGISQEKLAELSGLHRTYISGVERGERNPSLTSITRIAHALKITLSKMMEGVQ